MNTCVANSQNCLRLQTDVASLGVKALGKMVKNVEVIYFSNFQMMGSSKAAMEFHSSTMNKLYACQVFKLRCGFIQNDTILKA